MDGDADVDVDWTDSYRAWKADEDGVDADTVAVETVPVELPAGLVDAVDGATVEPAVFEARAMFALAEVTADRAGGPDVGGEFLCPEVDVPDGEDVETATLGVPLDREVAEDAGALVAEDDRFDDVAALLADVVVTRVLDSEGPFADAEASPERVRAGRQTFVDRVARGDTPEAVRAAVETDGVTSLVDRDRARLDAEREDGSTVDRTADRQP